MANLTRSAKCGSDWTDNELCAYNITVVPQTKEQFFGSAELPNPSITGFMEVEDRGGAEDSETRKLLHYLDLALNPKVGQESAVDNFVSKLLEKLGYDAEDRIIFIRHTLPFVICGTTSLAQIDVCIMDDNEILLLLVQEDNRATSIKDPEPQVIAEAIAAFALNNKTQQKYNLQPCNRAVIPAMTMAGTYPTFYKIPVTTQLSQAIQQGTYPQTETRILRFSPVLPRRISLGMRPLDNRGEILTCLEAFKQFLGA
ncbi:hypothetical protein BC826DRAFT_936201 [Russula brevipes]|nr:hypothetical protein BC826DRAFT_936201 [Russula brevipes]